MQNVCTDRARVAFGASILLASLVTSASLAQSSVQDVEPQRLAEARAGTIEGPDEIIEALERRVFFPEPHERAFDAARAVQREAMRRAGLRVPGYSRLLRLSVAAWSRAGDPRSAERAARSAVEAPETPLDGADAWRMLGDLHANDHEWADAERAYLNSIDFLDIGGYRDGNIRFPALVGLAGAHRARGRVDEAVRVQAWFLDQYGSSLKARETQHLYRVLAKDHGALANAEIADLWAHRLDTEYPDWGRSTLERVGFYMDIASRGDRAASRVDPAYPDRLRRIFERPDLRGHSASVLVGDEMLRAFAAQRRDSEAHNLRLLLVDNVWQMDEAGRSLHSPTSQPDRVAKSLLQGVAIRLLADHRSRSHVMQEEDLVEVATFVMEFFPETSMASQAADIVARLDKP